MRLMCIHSDTYMRLAVCLCMQSSQVSKYRGLLDAVRTMLKEEGISVFWYRELTIVY